MFNKAVKILILLALCAGVYLSLSKLDSFRQEYSKYYVEKNLLVTLPTNMIDYFTFGFDNLVADIVWIEFVQYFGENRLIKLSGSKDYDFSYSYKYVDVVTTLDPGFDYAYWFGAFAIADEMEEPKLAMKLLDRGIENNPDNYWLPYTGAIMELLYNGDYVGASEYASLAYKIRPENKRIARMKEVFESKAARIEKKRLLWMEVYKNARDQNDEMTMQKALLKLKNLGYNIDKLQ